MDDLPVNQRNIHIREIHPEEIPLLDGFLYDAIFIPEGVERPPFEIIQVPELALYYQDFGRPGDHCLVADQDGNLIGMIWTRLFSDTARGYGYVNSQTPEVSMSVKKPYRDQGVGAALFKAMMNKLEELGYEQVSLSVDIQNYAFPWYQKSGFKTVHLDGESVTMIKTLDNHK